MNLTPQPATDIARIKDEIDILNQDTKLKRKYYEKTSIEISDLRDRESRDSELSKENNNNTKIYGLLLQ